VKAIDVTRTLLITLVNHLVRFALEVGPVLLIERLQMLRCPDDFESYSFKRVAHARLSWASFHMQKCARSSLGQCPGHAWYVLELREGA